MMRRLVAALPILLAMVATALSAAPWLRTFPASTIAVALFGAAALSVLVPVVCTALGRRTLWQSALIDAAAFVVYTLVVVLRSPFGFSALWSGFLHGPSQLLTFALPLVSPPSLMVVPIALCWLGGVVGAESLLRARFGVLPYLGWLVTFGVAYAATTRSDLVSSQSNRASDTLLAGGLLLTMALLRAIQVWSREDTEAFTSQADSVLPVRGLVIGAVATVVVVALAALAVQAPVFEAEPAVLQRVPAVNQAAPVTPLAFVASLRPSSSQDPGQQLFDVNLDRAAPAYVSLASVDYYDGDSWSFNRTFRPSGGVVPADGDPALVPTGAAVTQDYRIQGSQLTAAPWMPYLDRPSKVTGSAVSVDAGSGMVVPTTAVRIGQSYSVRSAVPARTFASLPENWQAATSAPPADTQLDPVLRASLSGVVDDFASETGVGISTPTELLSAIVKDLRANYGLSGTSPEATATTPVSPASTAATSGGTSLAVVIASILGSQRTGTPEQYATLVALMARELGLPARVVTGFHLGGSTAAATVPAGNYEVTAAQAYTWVEVPVRNVGWAVLDPTPTVYSSDRVPPSVGAQPTSTPTPSGSANVLATATAGGHAVAPKSAVPHHAGHTVPIVLLSLVALLALMILAVCLLLLAKRNRRRRRRGAVDPRNRVIGAWQEALDLLSESGAGDVTALTSIEVAAVTEKRFGSAAGVQVSQIANVANVAIYSPATVIAVEDSEVAWQSQASLRRLVREALPWRTRLMAGLRTSRRSAPPATGQKLTGQKVERAQKHRRRH
jgi:transglutaminase-like putative cysteine protease